MCVCVFSEMRLIVSYKILIGQRQHVLLLLLLLLELLLLQSGGGGGGKYSSREW